LQHDHDPDSSEHQIDVARIQRLGEILFLVEVAFMLAGWFMSAAAFWVYNVYHIAALALPVFVLTSAHRATRTILPSIPLQRPAGVTLYLIGHFLQYIFPPPLPLELVAVCLVAWPLSMLLLFEP